MKNLDLQRPAFTLTIGELIEILMKLYQTKLR